MGKLLKKRNNYGFNRTFVYRGSNFAGSSYAGVGALGFGDGVERDVSGFRMVLSF